MDPELAQSGFIWCLFKLFFILSFLKSGCIWYFLFVGFIVVFVVVVVVFVLVCFFTERIRL